MTLFIVGCSSNNPNQKKSSPLVVKKLEISPEVISVGATAELKVALNSENSTAYNYKWSLEDNTAAEITPQGKEAVYKAKKPGKYRVNVIVANSSGEEITLKQTVEVKRNFTADIPQTVLLTDNLIIKGTVTSKIEKVKVKVDGYYLTDQITGSQEIIPNDEDNYKLSYKFHQAGQERDLIVEAYNKEGQIVDEIKAQIDVVTDKITANYNDQVFLTDEFEITGQVYSKIDKIKVKVDGHYLTDRITEQQTIIPDKSGNYKLKYKFHEVGQNRNLIIEGYNNNGQLIASKQYEIDVLEIKNKLSVVLPEQIVVNDGFKIEGQAYPPIEKIKIKLDGYSLTSQINVKENKYQLNNIKLNTAGSSRKLSITGYNQSGEVVTKLTEKVAVFSDQQLTIKVPKEIKKNESTIISGQALNPIAKIDFLVDGEYKLNNTKVEVTNGTYNFPYTFNSGGQNRELKVIGYDESGRKIAKEEIDFSVYDDEKRIIKNVPYYNQLRNYYKPYSTCQNTAMAMVLAYYGWTGDPDDIYQSYGKSAKSAVEFENIFNYYASASDFSVRLQTFWGRTAKDLEMRIQQGRPVVLHGRFTGSGHVVVLVGYDENYFYINDPAGIWNQKVYGGYNYNVITDGEYVKYPRERVMAALNNYNTVFTHEIVKQAHYNQNRIMPYFVQQLGDY